MEEREEKEKSEKREGKNDLTNKELTERNLSHGIDL